MLKTRGNRGFHAGKPVVCPRADQGAFDAYRLVPDLARARTPVFRRTMVNVGPERLPGLVGSYRHTWHRAPAIHRERRAAPAYDCWYCRRENGY